MKKKQVGRLWVFDNGPEPSNVRLSRVCDNLTRLYNRRYPDCFVVWDYMVGRNGNVALILWTREGDTAQPACCKHL